MLDETLLQQVKARKLLLTQMSILNETMFKVPPNIIIIDINFTYHCCSRLAAEWVHCIAKHLKIKCLYTWSFPESELRPA